MKMLGGRFGVGRRDIFPQLKDRKWFIDCVAAHFTNHHQIMRVNVRLSARRLQDAHSFWLGDEQRILQTEMSSSLELDHFKQAAHLAYWLRRSSPIVEIIDNSNSGFENIDENREFHYKYANEYSAFMFGYDICRFFEAHRVDSGVFANDFELDEDYVAVMCQFLKAKNVSPHALFLIYKSLFFNLRANA